jgi:hypothetical protein
MSGACAGGVVRSGKSGQEGRNRQPTLTIARLTALMAAALVALVAVPLAVGAALPGGAKYAGTTDDNHAVTVRLSGDAKRVKRLRINYTVTCDDGHSGDTYTDVLNAKVRSDHSFRASGMYTGSGDGSQNVFKTTGKVFARRASGTFSLTATSKPDANGTVLKCKTGKLTWSAKRQK